jgi:hypothetical protein
MQCGEDLGFGIHETLRSQKLLPQSDTALILKVVPAGLILAERRDAEHKGHGEKFHQE